MRELSFRQGRKLVLGMVHLQPLPGTPFYEPDSFRKTLARAVESARVLADGGASGCLLQTVDRVYGTADECDPARLSAIALLTDAVVRETPEDFQVGVQIQRNALSASLAAAKVSGATFVRAGALVGATLTEHGLMEAEPLRVMEYRKKIDAGNVRVIAEIDSPRFQWFGQARSTAEVARSAKLVGADAVCLGYPDEQGTLEKIAQVRAVDSKLPIILAGYTNHDNVERLLSAADGAFVGSCIERDGWGGVVDRGLVCSYMTRVRSLSA